MPRPVSVSRIGIRCLQHGGPYLNCSAGRSEFDGVTEKVPKHLLEPTGVPQQMIARGIELHLEANLLGIDRHLAELANRSDKVVNIDDLPQQRNFTFVDPR